MGANPSPKAKLTTAVPMVIQVCRDFMDFEKMKSLLRIRRPARRRVDRAGQGTGPGVTDGGLGADGTGDGVREFLAVGGISDLAAFCGVAEVAAFQQKAGDFRIPREADAAAHEAPPSDRGSRIAAL